MYSQYQEEQFILQAFENRAPRLLYDIGAWDPIVFSNSRALIERGWSAILIEPSPTPMLNLLKEYGEMPRVKLIQAAVSVERGTVELHVSDDAVTTSDAAEYEKWRNAAKFHGSMIVPAITLEDIGTRFGGADFINLDAEGLSVALFLEVMRLGWQPRCICVEHEQRTTEVLSAATTAGYSAVYANGTNLVLVR